MPVLTATHRHLSVAGCVCLRGKLATRFWLTSPTCLLPAALQGPSALLSIQHLIQHTRAKSTELPKEPADNTPAHPSVLDFIAADNANDETSEDEEAEQQAEAMMGLALAPANEIDWDAPLATGTLQEEAGDRILITFGDPDRDRANVISMKGICNV